MGKVLIIDDDHATCDILEQMISGIGHAAVCCQTLRDGLAAARKNVFDVVFLDVKLPDGSGLEHIKKFQEQGGGPEVIIITGAGSANGAEIAIKSGAWDYLQKPLSPKKIILPVKRVLEYRENLSVVRKRPKLLKRDRIIGSSRHLEHALEQLAQAAANDSNVLITGETGTGKEVFAQSLHENSLRCSRQLIVVDCAALPENLIESALFGHLKGAFTGADRSVIGLVKLADKGTLFLDEIGELSLMLQKTLLRVIQEKSFRPIGATQEQQSDFRLIAATNRNLEKMAGDGLFRDDLLFRLRSQMIEVPPLRARAEDITLLVMHCARTVTEKYGLKPKGFSPDFLETLREYQWPGNVRELVHAVEQAIFSAKDEPIMFPKHLPEEIRIKVIDTQLNNVARGNVWQSAPLPGASGAAVLPPFRQYRETAVEEVERRYLEELMSSSDGEIKKALAIAQMGRTRLYTLLKKHGITR